MKVTKIVRYLNDAFSWIMEKIPAVWSRWRQEAPEIKPKAMALVGFLTTPLGETEYALLKRVSGIVSTAVAAYLTIAAGLTATLVILGLCLLLSIGLYKVSGLRSFTE